MARFETADSSQMISHRSLNIRRQHIPEGIQIPAKVLWKGELQADNVIKLFQRTYLSAGKPIRGGGPPLSHGGTP